MISVAPQQNVPELRFSEFEGEWAEKRLGDFAVFSKGKGIAKSDIVEAGRTPCIRYGELYTEYGEIINEVVSSTNANPSELILSEENDVIVPASGETAIDIATASYVPYSGIALGGDLNIIRSKENGRFLAYYISGPNKLIVARLAQGNSVVHIYGDQLSSLLFYIPPQPEQNKITAFLAAMDEKIRLVSEKKALLEKYKKGVMQKLFAQDIRFKDDNGEPFPDWEKTELSQIITRHDSGIYKKSESYGQGHNIVGVSDLFSTHAVNGQEFRRVPLSQKEISENSLAAGDIIYAESSLVRTGIAKCVYVTLQGAGTCFAWHTRRFSVDSTKAVAAFIFYYLESQIARRYITSVATQTALTGITTKDYFKTPVCRPHPDEQKKISDFLTTIDEKIAAVDGQLKQAEAFKKGLLQQMFV